MAGYSGTPLVQKLGIKEGHSVLLVDAPADFEQLLAGLPANAVTQREGDRQERFPVILLFVVRLADLRRQFAGLREQLTPEGGLWVAWPKKASGVATDLTEDVIRAVGLKERLVDNKVCAVSDVWSGLRFVFRLQDRPKALKRSRGRPRGQRGQT